MTVEAVRTHSYARPLYSTFEPKFEDVPRFYRFRRMRGVCFERLPDLYGERMYAVLKLFGQCFVDRPVLGNAVHALE